MPKECQMGMGNGNENETEEQTGRMEIPSAMATSLEGSYRQIDRQDGRAHEWRGSVMGQEGSVTTCNREIWRHCCWG